jgi:hypothetical protein
VFTHQSSQNHEAENLFEIDCVRCMGKRIPEKGYRTADRARLPARFGLFRFFIEVSKGGRCSCVRSFNPYSTIVEEEEMKYA